jgi:nucleotide-binding universal stress UspA family protein
MFEPMYTDLLLPTDGSPGTAEALDHALAIAGAHDATVHVLYVVDRRHHMAAPEETKAEIRDALEKESERATDEARRRIEAEGLPTVTAEREGVPHREIVAYAHDHADIVVMGTHGKTGREQLATLGSTTERVVERSNRPVLVVDIGDA